MSLYVSKQNTLCLFIVIECKKLCFIQKLQEQSFIQDRASVSWEHLFLKRMKNRWEYHEMTLVTKSQQTLVTHVGWTDPFLSLKGTRRDHCQLHFEIYSVVFLFLEILTNSFSLFNKTPKVPHNREELFPCSSQTAWTGHQWVTQMT